MALFNLPNLPVIAQTPESPFKLLHSIPVQEPDLFSIDKLGNLYIARKGEVLKLDDRGKVQFRYNDMLLGEPTVIDPTNPLQILVYYRAFQTTVILDRTLTQTGKTDFWSLGLPAVPAVAMASDGNLWLYNEQKRTIQKINPAGNILVETADLAMLRGITPQAVMLCERNNMVFLQTTRGRVLIFDNFGGFMREIEFPITTLPGIHLNKEVLSVVSDGFLHQVDLSNPLWAQDTPLPHGTSPVRLAAIHRNQIYLVRMNAIECYRKQ